MAVAFAANVAARCMYVLDECISGHENYNRVWLSRALCASISHIVIAGSLRGRGRQCYVGEETDVTVTGKHIMAFCKSWRSCAIRSWSGGCKMAGAKRAAEKKQLPQ